MKKVFFVIVCAISLCAVYSNAQIKISPTTKKMNIEQYKYRYVRVPVVYFVNNGGGFSKTDLDFTLVEDAAGYYHIAYKTRYGVSYHSVQYANNNKFKYAFYMNGWFYFN